MDFRDFYFENETDRKNVRHIAELAVAILENEHHATCSIGDAIEDLQLIELYRLYGDGETCPADTEIESDIRAQIASFAPDYPTREMRERFALENA